MNEQNKFLGEKVEPLVPGITTEKEKKEFNKLDSHQTQLKNEELFYRVQER